MGGPVAEPGMFLFFQNCTEHTEKGIATTPRTIDGSVIPMDIIAKCSHVHCLQCGCIKSRTECLGQPFNTESKLNLAATGNHEFSKVKPTLGQNPFDYEKVEKTGPEIVEFKFRWSFNEGKDCWVEGVLPTQMAGRVIEIINTASIV